MRVVIVSKALVVGTYQKKCEELAKLPGVELTVIVPPAWQEEVRLIRLERAYTQGYTLLENPIWLNGNFHLHVYPGLEKTIKRIKPDIVHMDEEPYNLSTLQMQLAADRVGAKTLFFTWQNLYRTYPPPFSLIERTIYTRTEYALAGNVDAVGVLQRKGYAGAVKVIPQFGVDPDIFQPADPAAQPHRTDTFRIGYTGRLVEQKGVRHLLDAVIRLGGKWQLEMLGDGPLRAELEQRAQAAGVADRITFGVVPSTEIPQRLRGFDVLVLPSLSLPNWIEQFGRSIMEAMACEVPVIVSDSGELQHVAGEGGIIIPEGSVEAIQTALADLRDNPEKRFELARRGRQRVLKMYTQKQIAAQTYAVYQEMIGAAPADTSR